MIVMLMIYNVSERLKKFIHLDLRLFYFESILK